MNHEQTVVWLRRHPFMLLILLFALCDALLLFILLREERGVLTVAFLDVGQGDAVFIEAPNGNQLLYDAGPPTGAVLRELHKLMPFWDRSIDVLVFSHPDMDHIGGFPEVLHRYKVDVVLEPGVSSDNGVYTESMRRVQEEGAAHFIARKGMKIDLGGGVYADILYPDRDMSRMETNSASIVMRIHYGDTAFLLSGDLPKNIEAYQAQVYGKALSAEVLKLGHHGSRTSSGEEWLSAVAPAVAIISAGKTNRYGHPHAEVLALLARSHIPFLGTYDEGTLLFTSDGVEVVRQ